MKPEQNLDYLAAQCAQEIVKKDMEENTITKTLGVLQENGVYACFLYLLAREKEAAPVMIQKMRALLEKLGINNSPKDDLEYAKGLTQNLSTLLLAKEALERMLIYARYGAKAASEN